MSDSRILMKKKLNYHVNFSELPEDIRMMLMALGRKDPCTLKHSLRVMIISKVIASELDEGKDEKFIYELAHSCALHDIGKIIISNELLNKKKLTETEFEKIKEHVLFDAEKHFAVRLPEMCKQVIRHHHERENRSGYPDGLSGGEICLAAKICAVADSYDAMTGDRPYQVAKTPQEAFREITNYSGILFDSRIVKVFAKFKDQL